MDSCEQLHTPIIPILRSDGDEKVGVYINENKFLNYSMHHEKKILKDSTTFMNFGTTLKLNIFSVLCAFSKLPTEMKKKCASSKNCAKSSNRY